MVEFLLATENFDCVGVEEKRKAKKKWKFFYLLLLSFLSFSSSFQFFFASLLHFLLPSMSMSRQKQRRNVEKHINRNFQIIILTSFSIFGIYVQSMTEWMEEGERLEVGVEQEWGWSSNIRQFDDEGNEKVLWRLHSSNLQRSTSTIVIRTSSSHDNRFPFKFYLSPLPIAFDITDSDI